MQALSDASRCSCGLAKRFDPPSSFGSSISMVNCRDTRCPPISKPSTWLRLRGWPCQPVVTRQRGLPLAASRLTLSISANTSSTLMPFTTFGCAVFVLVWAFIRSLLRFGLLRMGSVERGERGLDALALLRGDEARQHLAELRVCDA